MKRLTIFAAALAMLCACTQEVQKSADVATLASSDGQINISLTLSPQGTLRYSVNYGDTPVVLPSLLGFDMRGTVKAEEFEYGTTDVTKRDSRPGFSMHDGFEVLGCTPSSLDETWAPVWGEELEIRNNYNELSVDLSQASGRKMRIIFRLFNDGLGFRYEFPDNQTLVYFVIKDDDLEMVAPGTGTFFKVAFDPPIMVTEGMTFKVSESSKVVGDAVIISTLNVLYSTVTTTGATTTYNNSVASNVIISNEGTTTVTYKIKDNAGNTCRRSR